MSKNWLIRSKSKQILGPVPLAKIKELISLNKLKDEDEICSGNGYWFFIKEKDLLDRFVMSGETQCFNPVSEAASVLVQGNDKQTAVFTLANLRGHIKETGHQEISKDQVHLPRSEDLEFPDQNNAKGVSPDLLSSDAPKKKAAKNDTIEKNKKSIGKDDDVLFPDSDDLEYPDLPSKK